jgi:SAM-dependent methyltransferase
MIDPRLILRLPTAYTLFTKIIGGRSFSDYLAEHVRPLPGCRVLDLGCGPGAVLDLLPSCAYFGIDIDPKYIAAAQRRFGSRAQFECVGITEFTTFERGAFDLVMANGLQHHLTDEEVGVLLRVAHAALKPSGRLVTIDGCFHPGQSSIARLLLRLDRGRHVRTQDGYCRLARGVFANVDSVLRHDLLRVPYTHHIMTCRR